jgi:PAS domain S-box-containing protein
MTSHSEETFQKLLLELACATFQSSDADKLLRSFCQQTREFFHAGGVYFSRRTAEGDLVATEGDGINLERFRGTRFRAGDGGVTLEAVKSRRTIFHNEFEMARHPKLAHFAATSVMSSPVIACNELVGAITFVHDTPDSRFDEDSAAKATVLATQLGTTLEAIRLNLLSREERRRSMILAEAATALQRLPDAITIMEGLADRMRALLHASAVLVFVQEERSFDLRALSTGPPALARAIRSRLEARQLRSAIELATRVISAGELITVSIDGASHFGEGTPSGVLVAAPFRTSRSSGAILVYPRSANPYTHEEKTLVSALAGFGAAAIANSELYGTACTQAQELQQILEISRDLGSAGKLEQFMQTSVARAASFLGFGRCCIGFLENDRFHVRWGFENGGARSMDISVYEGVATRALKQKEVFLTEDASKTPGADLDFVSSFSIRQLLAVPLLGANGDVLGMFGALDRLEPGPINPEDVRRAQALAAQLAMALELTRNLHQSEQHRRRAETLVELALELNAVLHLPDFTRNFALRASNLLGGRAVALSLFQDPDQGTLMLAGGSQVDDKPLVQRFHQALTEAAAKHTSHLVFAPAADLLGSDLASDLGWSDCTLVPLAGASGDLIGILCLADRGVAPSAEDHQLLRAIAGHASFALENACLFTRMAQANRHWMEVFDAIRDYIVVHDEQYRILRVNRSLADFVGVPPDQLIGVHIRALETFSTSASPHSCPFCRTLEASDEYLYSALERNFLISTSRIHSASSARLQTVHVLRDITDRREAERRYRELFDNIQEGIFFSTPEGRFVEVNDALVRILGYDRREEVLELDIPSQVYFSPQRREELAALLDRQGGLRNQQEILRRKDGSPVHVYINSIAIRDSHRQVVQYRGLMLDITGLRNSQIELQRERDFSSKVLNHTQSLILVTGTDGVISYANRRWAGLRFQPDQLLGRPFTDLAAPVRRDALRAALASVARGQQVDNFDLQLVRGDGASGQFSVNLSPINDENGSVTSIVVVMTDVTDSAVLQAKLVHSEKMAAVGQLVSGVAHEVNNPLTAILGFTDLLMENPDLPESARRDLKVILQEAQRTKQIVQNLLSFARQMPPQRLPVQLNSILRRTLLLRAYDFHSHGVEVVERLDESLPEVIGDSHQLQQVFLNIVNNAHDSVRESGRQARIEISSTSLGSWIEVSFRDNGVGIGEPDRIFDPFYTTKEVGKGTGLGLSICYGIVREHGGEIICHNNLDSEGATFMVRLPVASESASFGAGAGVYPK